MRANAAVQRATPARMEDPPDLHGALALCRAGAELARPAGSVFDEAQSLIMAAALATTLGTPDAAEDCIEALSFVRRTGYGCSSAARSAQRAGRSPPWERCGRARWCSATPAGTIASTQRASSGPNPSTRCPWCSPPTRRRARRYRQGRGDERRAVLDLADALHATRTAASSDNAAGAR